MIICAATFAIYRGSLNNYFICDDFIILHFAKYLPHPVVDYLYPHIAFSDPVMRSRYQPGSVIIRLLLFRLFDEDPAAYHLLSLVLHLANVCLVAFAASRLLPCTRFALLTALLFALAPQNGQMVMWVSCLPKLSSHLLVLSCLCCLFSRRKGCLPLYGLIYFVAVFTDVETAILPLLGAVYVVIYRRLLREHGRSGERVKLILIWSITASVVFIGNVVSAHYFPSGSFFSFKPLSGAAFIVNVLLPCNIPLAARFTLTGCMLVLAYRYRTPAVTLSLAAVLIGALFWSFIPLDPAPRYLYLYTLFSSMFTARLVLCLSNELRSRMVRRVSFAGAIIMLVLLNTTSLRKDQKWFSYLQGLGNKVNAIRTQGHNHACVYLEPSCRHISCGLNVFMEDVTFAAVPNPECPAIDCELEFYRPLYGRAALKKYWEFPWLWQPGH